MRDDLVFAAATSADAPQVQRVAAAAFAGRVALDPPSPAPTEPVDLVAAELEKDGGALIRRGDEVLACLRLAVDDDVVRLRRVAVHPDHQGHGYGTRLALWTQAWIARRRLEGDLPSVQRIAVDVRRELPANRRFWEVLEYEVVPSRPGLADYLLTLERPVPRAIAVPDALAMRDVGAQLAPLLRPGDLVLLHGPLGAGKTTLTQGLAAALHVRGAVTSPTFVIARAHPGRLPLVHVDAYRVGSGLEVDDLDLDTSLEESVTVVEWGEGLVEDLAADRLEVRIERAEEADDERRVVVVEAFGPRWTGVALPGADTAG
jgi:tRNA threonylcarbamoyladenosine biosynthesis protein TsaE